MGLFDFLKLPPQSTAMAAGRSDLQPRPKGTFRLRETRGFREPRGARFLLLRFVGH
jgi:hypothetical protein